MSDLELGLRLKMSYFTGWVAKSSSKTCHRPHCDDIAGEIIIDIEAKDLIHYRKCITCQPPVIDVSECKLVINV